MNSLRNNVCGCFLLLAALLIVPASLAQADQPQAVLLAVSGNVGLIRDGRTDPAQTGLALKMGDKLTSTGGKATLLMADGQIRRLGKNQNISITNKDSAVADKNLAAKLIDAAQETMRLGQTPTKAAVVRGQKEIFQIFPRNSVIFNDDLRFAWSGVEKGREVELIILSESPAFKHIFKAKTAKGGVTYPKQAPPLNPGRTYYWKVDASPSLADDLSESKLSWFQIITPDKLKDLQKRQARLMADDNLDSRSSKLIAAYLLLANKMYHEAYKLLLDCQLQSPGDQGIKSLLAGVEKRMYGQI